MLAALPGGLLCNLERDEALWGGMQQGSGHLFPFQHEGNAWGAPEMHCSTAPNRWLVPNALQDARKSQRTEVSLPSVPVYRGGTRSSPDHLSHEEGSHVMGCKGRGVLELHGAYGMLSGKPKGGRGRSRVMVR